jgi:hypothetical protein
MGTFVVDLRRLGSSYPSIDIAAPFALERVISLTGDRTVRLRRLDPFFSPVPWSKNFSRIGDKYIYSYFSPPPPLRAVNSSANGHRQRILSKEYIVKARKFQYSGTHDQSHLEASNYY